MNLTCSILHANAQTARMLEKYARQTSFLTLCGTYTKTGDALKDYYARKVDVYFIGLEPCPEGDDLSGLEFARLLTQPTRCIFIARDGAFASRCFRLDALDYLEGDVQFPVFFQAISKALRWFSLQRDRAQGKNNDEDRRDAEGCPDVMYIRAESRLIRLKLDQICYIEGLGDYVKIFCRDEAKPILSLCSLKYLEGKLPDDMFMRVHRSYIVRKACIRAIMPNSMCVVDREIPIGEVYKRKVKGLVAGLHVL